MSDYIKLVYYDFFVENQLIPFLMVLIGFLLMFIFTIVFVIIEYNKMRSKEVNEKN